MFSVNGANPITFTGSPSFAMESKIPIIAAAPPQSPRFSTQFQHEISTHFLSYTVFSFFFSLSSCAQIAKKERKLTIEPIFSAGLMEMPGKNQRK
jgi:hypothetical protein